MYQVLLFKFRLHLCKGSIAVSRKISLDIEKIGKLLKKAHNNMNLHSMAIKMAPTSLKAFPK